MNTPNDRPTDPKEVWIALVGVEPGHGCEALALGDRAWVNVLAWANSSNDFKSQLREALVYYSMRLLSMEDLEPFQQRLSRAVVDDYLRILAAEVQSSKD